MPHDPTIIELVTQAFETKFGGWIQPNELDPCRAGLGGCPVMWTSGYELRELTAVWQRVPGAAVPQDAAMCTFHFLNLTGGNPDSTWVTADYTTVEGAFNSAWNGISNDYSSEVKLIEYRWRADGPAFRPHGTELAPTLRTVAANLTAGSASAGSLPPQVAVSVTEVTPAKFTVEDVEGVGTQTRNRWGRFYLPPPATTAVTAMRISSAVAGNIATRIQTFYNACVTADLIPVMYSPTTGNAWSVSDIHVDDIFDVIRSRRFVTPLSRNSKAINQP